MNEYRITVKTPERNIECSFFYTPKDNGIENPLRRIQDAMDQYKHDRGFTSLVAWEYVVQFEEVKSDPTTKGSE